VWQDQAVSDIEHMIERDRHRPSIIVWGARLNETPDRPEFYARTEALVKRLDPSRATSGTMFGDYARTAIFQHDVFGYDDYTTALDADGERYPVLLEPIEGRPYLVSEGISTRSSPTTFYLRNDPPAVQQHQALDYAMTHDVAMGDKRFAGLLAWVGFDYQANMGNHHRGIKTSGLGDVFRVLKPGAAIYRSQVDPAERVVIEPAFSWDPPEFGQPGSFDDRPEHRLWGPGAKAMICSNCDRLDVYLGDRLVESVRPDRKRFPNLPYAPSFVDLRLLPHDTTDLRIDGFVGDERVGRLARARAGRHGAVRRRQRCHARDHRRDRPLRPGTREEPSDRGVRARRSRRPRRRHHPRPPGHRRRGRGVGPHPPGQDRNHRLARDLLQLRRRGRHDPDHHQ
jgi:beta-galactosidase